MNISPFFKPAQHHVSYWLLSICSVAVFGCSQYPENESQLRDEFAASSDTNIMLNGSSDQIPEIHISTLAAVTTVGLCILPENSVETCTTGHASYSAAVKTNSNTERSFYKMSQATQLDSTKVYHVLDATSGKVIQKFKIVQKSSGVIVPPAGGEVGLDLIKEATMRQELTYFSSDELNGRLSGTTDNEKAADYIISQLKSLNIQPANGADYRQDFKLSVGPMAGRKTSNLVALLPGQDSKLKDEYVVIGAHMDHAGTLSKGYTCSKGFSASNSICNGADDNGSGTVSVLNVAKALASIRGSLKRSVVIMWFSGEEEGLLGSKYYVNNSPIIPLNKTVYMINLDMVGYMKSNGNTLAALGGGTSEVGERLLKEIGTKYQDRKISVTARAGGGSDHVPFMAKGIPGVFLHTGVSNNKSYHRTSDTAEKVDYAGMEMAAKVAFELTERVANEASLSDSLTLTDVRAPFVTEEEMQQTCHHLMQNPFVEEALDFSLGNDGR